MDLKEANIGFHHSERLKSNFLLVAQTLDSISGLYGQELGGAKYILQTLLEALLIEIRIAAGQTSSWELGQSELKIVEAGRNIELGNYDRARESLSEGLSKITTLSQQYIGPLIAAGLL